VLRYLLAAAVGYALGRRNRRVVATAGPATVPLDSYDDVLDDDGTNEREFFDEWRRRMPPLSHGYVPALPTEAAR
jgi:hypothetical protein